MVDPATGEAKDVHIFTTTLGFSSCVYAEIFQDEKLPQFIGGCGHILGPLLLIKPLEFASFYINDQGRVNPVSGNSDVRCSINITLRYGFVDIYFQLIIVS